MKSAVLLLAACGHAAPPTAPDYRAVRVTTVSPAGELYAGCLADAVANHRVANAQDSSTTLLVFTCTAAPARAFFDQLGPWSARIGSEVTTAGRTLRSAQRVRRDLFGVDYCASDGASYECVVSLNVGDFAR